MSNGLNRKNPQDRVKGLGERVTQLEQRQLRGTYDLNQFKGQVQAVLTQLDAQLDAITEILGRDQVQEVMQKAADAKAQAEADANRASIAQNVADGVLVPEDTLGDKSIGTGHFINADGKIQHPGYYQFAMPQIDPGFRGALAGKGVGAVIDTNNGEKFEVTGIYRLDLDRANALMEERRQAAIKAAEKVAEVEAKAEAEPEAAAPAPEPQTETAPQP